MWNNITLKGTTFSDDVLLDGSCYLSSSLPGDELAIDTLTFILYFAPGEGSKLIPSGSDQLITADSLVFCVKSGTDVDSFTQDMYGEPVTYEHEGELIGKFYVDHVLQVGPRSYKYECVSAMGLLDAVTHYGGIYANVTVADLIDEVIGSTITYTAAQDLALTTLSGWLPIDTGRNNLHRILLSVGGSVVKGPDGEVYFSFVTGGTPLAIPDRRFYDDGSINFETPCSEVQLTEHAFYALQTDTVKTLFDNTDGSGVASSQLVKFDGPYHDLVATGVTIEEAHVNYCVVTGTGTVTGQQYTHTRKVLSKTNVGVQTENVIQVSDDLGTLIGPLNSQNALDRLFNYYSMAQTVKSSIVVEQERPMRVVSFNDPWGAAREGFITRLPLDMSHTLKATGAEIVCGYSPGPFGNNFKTCVVLTVNTNWQVPAGVTKIRAVLIGGGEGGASGEYGHDGAHADPFDNPGKGGARGDGGLGGLPGLPGKVLVVDMTVTPGNTVAAGIGAGGTGGVADSSGSIAGSAGGATTFGLYSSADGAIPENGVLQMLTGDVYALNGSAGIAGNPGSDDSEAVAPIIWQGQTYNNGDRGNNYVKGSVIYAYGGYGGGASGGANGNIGDSGWYSAGGDGGDGAEGMDGADGISYGSGGSGGNGGGGGGQGGNQLRDEIGNPLEGGDGGKGGAGGDGGDGGQGCVLIYY